MDRPAMTTAEYRRVVTAAKRFERAHERECEALAEAINAAADAIAAGAMSERTAARVLNLDRITLRKHLGKIDR